MKLVPSLPRAAGAVEMLDRPAAFAELRQGLADVARLNGLFGGRLLTVSHVKRLLARTAGARPLTVLDVGTGGADIPRALARWARRTGRAIRIVALDRDGPTLEVARRHLAGYPEVTLLRGDALALPVRPGSVDVAISALTLHHLEPDGAARHLAELDRAARCGLVVNDLARSRTAYGLVWLATRLLSRSAMSRHDGPMSVRRAYAPAELRAICDAAGLGDVRIVRYRPLLRQCAVRSK